MAEAPGANGPQPVHADDARHHAGVERDDQLVEQHGVSLVEQAAGSVPHQACAGEAEVDANEGSDERIQPRDAGQAHEEQANDHTRAGPEVRDHVLAVGDQRQRVVTPAGADEKHAEAQG